MDGTGEKAILDERDSAKSDLATKEATLKNATEALNGAKRADAQKAEQLEKATTNLDQATTTLKQTEKNFI